MSEDVAIAQIVTAITTVFYAAVFAIGYYLIIRGNRQTLREMRQERLSGGRPQVIVEMSLLNLPMVELVSYGMLAAEPPGTLPSTSRKR
jgi:hypothetical protein